MNKIEGFFPEGYVIGGLSMFGNLIGLLAILIYSVHAMSLDCSDLNKIVNDYGTRISHLYDSCGTEKQVS